MITFKNFLLMIEELNASQKAEVAKWPRDPAALAHTDHYFGKGNDDITTKLDGTQDKSEIHKQIERHLEKSISPEDYKANIYGKSVKISRAIKDPVLLQNFNSDPTRQGKNYTGLSVHATRSAHGVAGQTSSGQSWEQESCKNFANGRYKGYLEPEVKHGTVVTYLKDHKGKEIARATLHPHYNNEGHVSYAVNSYYGIDHEDFHDHIDQLSKDLSGPHKGGNLTYTIHPDVYNDMRHNEILHPAITTTGLKTIQSKHPNNLSIQRAIFNHPNVTNGMLHDGIKSDNEDIASLALDSSRLKSEHIDTALSHSSPLVRVTAMESKKVSKTQLHTALKDSSTDVRLAALWHPKIKEEHLDAVLADKTNKPNVRERAVRHGLATENHINQGLADSDYRVKLSAIRNKNVTPDNITNALKVISPSNDLSQHNAGSATYLIHKTAINHPSANESHFKMALNHPDQSIRELAKRRLEKFQRNLR